MPERTSHEAVARSMRREELINGYVSAHQELDALANQKDAVAAIARVQALAARFEADTSSVSAVSHAIATELRNALDLP